MIFQHWAERQGVTPVNKLFAQLPQHKKAAALNILAKMAHVTIMDGTVKSVLSYVDHIYGFYQDRIYVRLNSRVAQSSPLRRARSMRDFRMPASRRTRMLEEVTSNSVSMPATVTI